MLKIIINESFKLFLMKFLRLLSNLIMFDKELQCMEHEHDFHHPMLLIQYFHNILLTLPKDQ